MFLTTFRSRIRISGMVALLAVLGLMPAAAGDEASPTFAGSKENKHTKLHAQLVAVDRTAHEQGENAALDDARRRGLTVEERKVRVVLEGAGGDRAHGRAATEAHAGKVEAEHAGLVQALLPPGALRAAAERNDISFVRPPLPWRTAAVTDEGIGAMNAQSLHARNVKGSGVRIAIVDAGFDGYAARQAGGDLPADVTTVGSVNGSQLCSDFDASEHGTAVAEIVHDVAPEAQLYLICVSTEVTLGLAKDYAKANGIAIINHSIVWYNSSRGDGNGGSGTPDAIVRDARNNGILWVNAAGNDAEKHWSGTFTDANNDGALNFSGTDQTNDIVIRNGEQACFTLKWDRWPRTNQDFDLYLYDVPNPASNTLPIAGSSLSQTGIQPPTEDFCYTNSLSSRPFYLLIARIAGVSSPRFDLFSLTFEKLQHRVAAGSILEPGSSPSAFAAGATCWLSGALEPYSARGPTIDGRVKPDIAGPDSVSTATYGAFGSCGSPAGFAGTSASAPHVSGAAALIKQLHPTYGPATLQSYLEKRALDVAPAGKDNGYGSGWLWMRTFTDVPPSDYGYTSIELLAASGITTGCASVQSTGDIRYCPNNFITRAEMAPFLLRAMGLGPCTTCTTQTFADVPTTHWAWRWIEQLVRQGITSGCATSPRRYCPSDDVTRAQMAPFLMRAAGLGPCGSCTTQTFTDVPRSYWAWRWIEQLVREGVTVGCSTSPRRYCPENDVTRRDMAIFIAKTFELT